MKTPQNTHHEKARLLELKRFDVLDTPKEQEFDDLVLLASQICNVPYAFISLVEDERQWFKATVGIQITETPRNISFCQHAIESTNEIFEIEDAQCDDRFVDNPLFTDDLKIRFYAGVVLKTNKGYNLGTLCVVDTKPHVLSNNQKNSLKILGRQVIKLLELRIDNKLLQQQKNKLKAQAKMQNRITAILAHDVRSPLAAIKQLMEYLNLYDTDINERKQITEMTEKQLGTTLVLLNELLVWSKVQGQTFSSLKFTPVKLYNIVEEKFTKSKPFVVVKNNKLINLVDKDLHFSTDINVLKFILRNLISNANKFTQNGTITVYAQQEKDKVLISVSDTGIGMQQVAIDNLFNPDAKKNTNGTLNEKGLGLGLIFIKDFVDLLQGEITVKSEINKGTTFYLKLKL